MGIRSLFRRIVKPENAPAPRAVDNASTPQANQEAMYPWLKGRTPVLQRLLPHQHAAGPIPGPDLELKESDPDALNWAPGAMDAVLGLPANPEEKAAEVFLLLSETLSAPSVRSFHRFYDYMAVEEGMGYADEIVDMILTQRETLPLETYALLARAFVIQGADPGPIKLGIVLLGLLNDRENAELFRLIGLHDEFTLYAVVALRRLLDPEKSETVVWDMAKRLRGWGRIHAVRRLLDSENPELKAWLIREGFRNGVMYEYLAHDCAVSGGLLQELGGFSADQALLDGAAEIFHALCLGGPAEDMRDYEDGPAAVSAWLGHLEHLDRYSPGWVTTLKTLLEFIETEEEEESPCWTETERSETKELAGRLLYSEASRRGVAQGLGSEDESEFWNAKSVAPLLGIDPWEACFKRGWNKGQDADWACLFAADDPARISQVIDLAMNAFNLEEIASGPSDALRHNLAGWSMRLDAVLSSLERHPGQGWPLLKTGMKSLSSRNRRTALRTLGNWEHDSWPEEAYETLVLAASTESDREIREEMQGLLNKVPRQ